MTRNALFISARAGLSPEVREVRICGPEALSGKNRSAREITGIRPFLGNFIEENEENLTDFKVKVDFFPALRAGQESPPAPPVLTERGMASGQDHERIRGPT